jgi:hypothetical protein
LAGNEREAKNSQCHHPQSDKKFRRHCWQAMQTFGNNQCQWVVLSAGQIGMGKIMTRTVQIAFAVVLLLGGATFALAQNGPPTGRYPPARWNPNLYGHGYHRH